MMHRRYLFVLVVVVFSLNLAVASAQPTGQDLNYILGLLGNPSVLLIFGIELLLGIGLGYFAMKALKYVIAIILILALGIILNIWQSPSILRTIQEQLGGIIGMSQLSSVMLSIVYALGLTTILPMALGLVIGIILGIIR